MPASTPAKTGAKHGRQSTGGDPDVISFFRSSPMVVKGAAQPAPAEPKPKSQKVDTGAGAAAKPAATPASVASSTAPATTGTAQPAPAPGLAESEEDSDIEEIKTDMIPQAPPQYERQRRCVAGLNRPPHSLNRWYNRLHQWEDQVYAGYMSHVTWALYKSRSATVLAQWFEHEFLCDPTPSGGFTYLCTVCHRPQSPDSDLYLHICVQPEHRNFNTALMLRSCAALICTNCYVLWTQQQLLGWKESRDQLIPLRCVNCTGSRVLRLSDCTPMDIRPEGYNDVQFERMLKGHRSSLQRIPLRDCRTLQYYLENGMCRGTPYDLDVGLVRLLAEEVDMELPMITNLEKSWKSIMPKLLRTDRKGPLPGWPPKDYPAKGTFPN